MKKGLKFNIIAILLLSIATMGCSDFLDKQPENVVPKDEVDYADKKLMYAPVSTVYSLFGQCVTSWSMNMFLVIRSDQLTKGSWGDGDQIELLEFKQFQYRNAPTFWMNDGAWIWFYDVIIASNSAIEALDRFASHLTSQQDIDLNNQYKAEVRFLRSYIYFIMTRLWGDVPVFVDNKKLDGIYRTARTDVYKFIDKELADVANILPDMHPSAMVHVGAATSYSALALKAKVAADAGDWESMFSASETIINSEKFTLYDDYYQLFKKSAFLCSESLFEAQFSDFKSETGDVKSDNYLALVQGPGAWIDNEAGRVIKAGWGFLPVTESLEQKMIARNEVKRMKTTFLYSASGRKDGEREYNGVMYPYSLTPSGDQIFETTYRIYNGKVYVPSDQMIKGREDYGCYNNLRMIRYADILLLNAEARVHKGLSGDGPFNTIRDRAGLDRLSNVTLEQIYDERDMELALEFGERYYDLTRTGRAGILPGYSEAVRFYPIPRAQIDLNPNLAK